MFVSDRHNLPDFKLIDCEVGTQSLCQLVDTFGSLNKRDIISISDLFVRPTTIFFVKWFFSSQFSSTEVRSWLFITLYSVIVVDDRELLFFSEAEYKCILVAMPLKITALPLNIRESTNPMLVLLNFEKRDCGSFVVTSWVEVIIHKSMDRATIDIWSKSLCFLNK